MPLVSVVIPARNEAENIGPTINGIRKKFRKHRIDYEIIVVNDGSTDDTEKAVRVISEDDPCIRILRNRQHGFGNAIARGLNSFRGDCVVVAMADSSDDPSDMVKYIRKVQDGYDCCFGTRWHAEAEVEGYPIHKLLLNRIVNWWIKILFGLPYNDTTNAFKCYSKETIEGIQPILSRHFNITVELPLKAIVRGYNYAVIPTSWRERRRGKTSLKIQEMGSRYLFIIIYVFLEKLLCGGDYKRE